MNAAEYDTIAARAEAATEGPWTAVTTRIAGGDHWYICNEGEAVASVSCQDGINEDQREPDAEFIAHARTDIPALLVALRERDTTITRLQDAVLHMTIHPEGTAGAAEGFTTVSIEGSIDIITCTDFPAYRELDAAKATITALQDALTVAREECLYADLDAKVNRDTADRAGIQVLAVEDVLAALDPEPPT